MEDPIAAIAKPVLQDMQTEEDPSTTDHPNDAEEASSMDIAGQRRTEAQLDDGAQQQVDGVPERAPVEGSQQHEMEIESQTQAQKKLELDNEERVQQHNNEMGEADGSVVVPITVEHPPSGPTEEDVAKSLSLLIGSPGKPQRVKKTAKKKVILPVRQPPRKTAPPPRSLRKTSKKKKDQRLKNIEVVESRGFTAFM